MLGWRLFQTSWAFFGYIDVVAYLVGTDTTDGSALKLSFEGSSWIEQSKGTIISANRQTHRKLKSPISNQDLPDVDLLALSRVGRSNMYFVNYVGGKILPSTRFCVPCKVLPPTSAHFPIFDLKKWLKTAFITKCLVKCFSLQNFTECLLQFPCFDVVFSTFFFL